MAEITWRHGIDAAELRGKVAWDPVSRTLTLEVRASGWAFRARRVYNLVDFCEALGLEQGDLLAASSEMAEIKSIGGDGGREEVAP